MEALANHYANEHEVVLLPPIERFEAETDEDSELSDEEYVGDVNHLPRRILTGEQPPTQDDNITTTSTSMSNTNNSNSNNDNQEWKINQPFSQQLPPFKQQCSIRLAAARNIINTPADCFLYFLNEEFTSLVATQSNFYAAQHNRQLNVTTEEVKVFICILLLSGYSPLPNRRLYWSSDPDVINEQVINAMRRNRFEDIMRNLHFADNTAITDDRYYKVRPLFTAINAASPVMPMAQNICVDESMIKYYGMHSGKQYMRGKPIKYGFKVWSLASSNGYIHRVEPYCGKTKQSRFGCGYDVVTTLVEDAEVQPGSSLFMDNYFTSFHLFKELFDRGIGATGTIRVDRIKDCPLKDTYKKTHDRGSTTSASSSSLLVACWGDNRNVLVCTNHSSVEPQTSCLRWSRSEHKRVCLRMPKLLAEYNQHMGGVDQANASISNYRVKIRSKKWWWPFFSWTINVLLVNSWRLYQDIHNPKISLLEYERLAICRILQLYGEPLKTSGRRSQQQTSLQSESRFDRLDHWPESSNVAFGVCAVCKGRSKIRCSKCGVALHPANCFKLYHTL